MREVVKTMLCFLASIGWAMAIQKWAPDTVTRLLIALVPSLLLGSAGALIAIRIQIRQSGGSVRQRLYGQYRALTAPQRFAACDKLTRPCVAKGERECRWMFRSRSVAMFRSDN
jgi:hypothetical protein